LYCPPALRDILLACMARYSLFVLKVPLNTKQTNKKILSDCCINCTTVNSFKPHISKQLESETSIY